MVVLLFSETALWILWDLMTSYEILWAWITRPKTWINEQRPRLACATRSQAPCLLCGVFFQNFGTNELEIVSRSSTLLWMDQWLSFSEVMFLLYYDIIWLGYESCACRLCFPMCYPWNRFGKLCVRIYSSGSATVPPSHCPIVKRNTKRCQHVEAGPVFKDLCRNIYPTWTSCNQNKYIGWSLVGHWVSYSCLAVVECVGRRFYLLSYVVLKQI